MAIIEVNKDNFEQEVLKSENPVLVDFNAAWCGPCRMLRPVLEELADEISDYKFVSINIDKEESLADEFNISSIPCLVVIKNGKEENRAVGFRPKEELESFIRGK